MDREKENFPFSEIKPTGQKEYKDSRSFRIKFLQLLADLVPMVDRAGRIRAGEILEQSGILKYLKDGGRYLDIGTGPGHILELLNSSQRRDIEFVGLDNGIAPVYPVNKRLREKGKLSGERLFVYGSGESLPVKEKSLDGATVFFVLHHAGDDKNLEQIFNEIDRVVKDDGFVSITEDIPETADKDFYQEFDQAVNFELGKKLPHFFRSDKEWRKFFEQHGYEIVEVSYFSDKYKGKNIDHATYILKRKPKQD